MKGPNTTNVEITVPNGEGMFFISITNPFFPSFSPGQTSISFSPSTTSSSSVSPCTTTTTASPSFSLFSSSPSPVRFNVICPSPVSSGSLVSQQSSTDSLNEVISNGSDIFDNDLNYMEIERDLEDYDNVVEAGEEDIDYAMDIEVQPIRTPSAPRSSSVRRHGKGGKCPKKPSRLPSL